MLLHVKHTHLMTNSTMCSTWNCCGLVTLQHLRAHLLLLLLLLLLTCFQAICCSLALSLLCLLLLLLQHGRVLLTLLLLLLRRQSHSCCLMQLLTQHLQLHVLKLHSIQAQHDGTKSVYLTCKSGACAYASLS
jgi:hypothetical protein